MTNEIEKTKRELYGCLDRIRRAAKHRALTAEFEERLEEHLEALRQDGEWMRKQLATIRQTNVDIQERLQAVDGAYFEQSKLVVAQAEEIRQLKTAAQIAGEELQHVQSVSRSRDIEVKSGRLLLAGRDETIAELRAELTKVREISRRNLEDCRSAEKCSDDFSEKLSDAQAVIGHQEQLIAGQRKAIADMHAELAHSRVIRKAFISAQEAFAVMDSALHSSATYSSQKALGDDVVDSEFLS